MRSGAKGTKRVTGREVREAAERAQREIAEKAQAAATKDKK